MNTQNRQNNAVRCYIKGAFKAFCHQVVNVSCFLPINKSFVIGAEFERPQVKSKKNQQKGALKPQQSVKRPRLFAPHCFKPERAEPRGDFIPTGKKNLFGVAMLGEAPGLGRVVLDKFFCCIGGAFVADGPGRFILNGKQKA